MGKRAKLKKDYKDKARSQIRGSERDWKGLTRQDRELDDAAEGPSRATAIQSRIQKASRELREPKLPKKRKRIQLGHGVFEHFDPTVPGPKLQVVDRIHKELPEMPAAQTAKTKKAKPTLVPVIGGPEDPKDPDAPTAVVQPQVARKLSNKSKKKPTATAVVQPRAQAEKMLQPAPKTKPQKETAQDASKKVPQAAFTVQEPQKRPTEKPKKKPKKKKSSSQQTPDKDPAPAPPKKVKKVKAKKLEAKLSQGEGIGLHGPAQGVSQMPPKVVQKLSDEPKKKRKKPKTDSPQQAQESPSEEKKARKKMGQKIRTKKGQDSRQTPQDHLSAHT